MQVVEILWSRLNLLYTWGDTRTTWRMLVCETWLSATPDPWAKEHSLPLSSAATISFTSLLNTQTYRDREIYKRTREREWVQSEQRGEKRVEERERRNLRLRWDKRGQFHRVHVVRVGDDELERLVPDRVEVLVLGRRPLPLPVEVRHHVSAGAALAIFW